MKKDTQGGYAGMISLLVATAVLALLYMLWIQAPVQTPTAENDFQPNNVDGTTPTTRYESYQADLDAAQGAQDILNAGNATIEEELHRQIKLGRYNDKTVWLGDGPAEEFRADKAVAVVQ